MHFHFFCSHYLSIKCNWILSMKTKAKTEVRVSIIFKCSIGKRTVRINAPPSVMVNFAHVGAYHFCRVIDLQFEIRNSLVQWCDGTPNTQLSNETSIKHICCTGTIDRGCSSQHNQFYCIDCNTAFLDHKNFVSLFEVLSKMNCFIGSDDDAPPTKRLKLNHAVKTDGNNNIENAACEFGLPSPNSDVRKRKVPAKTPAVKNILDLNVDVILETFKYLPLNG